MPRKSSAAKVGAAKVSAANEELTPHPFERLLEFFCCKSSGV
jgi:hypothetical protein